MSQTQFELPLKAIDWSGQRYLSDAKGYLFYPFHESTPSTVPLSDLERRIIASVNICANKSIDELEKEASEITRVLESAK